MTSSGDPLDALPPGVALAWGLQAGATRGPKPALTLDGIVDAAIALADVGGLGAVSMNKVAEALGFTTMSLYRYVRAKDDLLALMGDAALGDPVVLPDGDWRVRLDAWARTILEVYRRRTWILDVPISGMPMLPNQLGWLDRALQAMADSGLTHQEQLSSSLLIDGYVRSWAQLSSGLAQMANPMPDGEPPPPVGPMMRQLVDPVRYPALTVVIDAGEFDDDEDELDSIFDFGLERVLDGIDVLVQRNRGATTKAAKAAKATKATKATRTGARRR